MKICPNCSSQNEDAALLCVNCGTGFMQQPKQTYNKGYQQQNQQYQHTCTNGINPDFSLPPAIQILKNLGSSTGFLIAVISFTSTIFFCIFSVPSNEFLSNRFYGHLYGEFDESFYQTTASLPDIFNSCLAFTPYILICIGIWRFYISCKKANARRVLPSGLKLIKVIIMILTIVFCIFGLALLVVSLTFGFITPINRLAFGIALPLVVLYNLKVLQTIKSIRTTLATGQPPAGVSILLAIFNYISAGITLSSGVLYLLGVIRFKRLELFSLPVFLSCISYAVFLILISNKILNYRKQILNLLYSIQAQCQPYMQPVYSNPVIAQPQPGTQQGQPPAE